MRPITMKQNTLRYPLNDILGTRAHIRLLRIMASDLDSYISLPDLARQVGLTIPGAQKALKKLFETGSILRVGGSGKYLYKINSSNNLMKAILKLFQVEKDQFELLITAIKKEIEKLTPYASCVWIQNLSEGMDSTIILSVLHKVNHLTEYSRKLQKHMDLIGKSFDVTIEVEAYTKADIADQNLEDIMLLYGVFPSSNKLKNQMLKKPVTHKEKDQFLYELSCQLAKTLTENSSLIVRAGEHLNKLLKEDHGLATSDIKEWQDIIQTYSIQRLSKFLKSTSERAIRLRQSNPFFAVLTPDEKSSLIKKGGRR